MSSMAGITERSVEHLSVQLLRCSDKRRFGDKLRINMNHSFTISLEDRAGGKVCPSVFSVFIIFVFKVEKQYIKN